VGVKQLLARVADLDDRQARKMALWENLHRADLSPVEEACGVVDWLDAALEDEEAYQQGGKTAVERARAILGTRKAFSAKVCPRLSRARASFGNTKPCGCFP
jgi:hypothetical protein